MPQSQKWPSASKFHRKVNSSPLRALAPNWGLTVNTSEETMRSHLTQGKWRKPGKPRKMLPIPTIMRLGVNVQRLRFFGPYGQPTFWMPKFTQAKRTLAAIKSRVVDVLPLSKRSLVEKAAFAEMVHRSGPESSPCCVSGWPVARKPMRFGTKAKGEAHRAATFWHHWLRHSKSQTGLTHRRLA